MPSLQNFADCGKHQTYQQEQMEELAMQMWDQMESNYNKMAQGEEVNFNAKDPFQVDSEEKPKQPKDKRQPYQRKIERNPG